MSDDENEATAALTAAVTSVIAAVAVVAVDELFLDGRSDLLPRSRRNSTGVSLFSVASMNSVFDNGWFSYTFRCSKRSFERILTRLSPDGISLTTILAAIPSF